MTQEAYDEAVRKMIYWRTWESYLISALILMLPILMSTGIPLTLYLPLYVLVAGAAIACNDRRLAYRARAAWLYEDN